MSNQQLENEMSNALQTTKDLPLAPVTQQPSVGEMLYAVVKQGVTNDNVEALEKIVGLYERVEAKNSEKAFNASFVALQSEMPVIVAKSVIPNRGKYERFEDVMEVVGPLLIKNGFSVSFEQFADDKRIRVTCHLRHIGGHSVPTAFAVRLGGRADSDTQADCKASTTAKRNALLQALNIVIRQDCLADEDDARNEGTNITGAQVDELERRVKETNSDVAKFLKVAGATSFATILSGKYDVLDQMLRTKEQGR